MKTPQWGLRGYTAFTDHSNGCEMLKITEKRFISNNILLSSYFQPIFVGLIPVERSMTTIDDVMKRHHQTYVSEAKFTNCDRATSRVGYG